MFLKSNKNTPKIETIIGPGTEMEGNLISKESVRVDGKLKGEVKAYAVVLGEYGVILGDITAVSVTIAGKVKGNVSASETLELLPKGQILGDIKSSKLVIADGALFEGNCQMVKADGQVIELPQVVHDGENHKLKVVNGSNGQKR